MKKYASKTLRLIALLYCAVPVFYPAWLTLWFNIAGSRVVSLFLSPIYWFVVVLCMLSGIGMWEMRRWTWYVFLSANLFLIYENAFVAATYGESAHLGIAFLLSVSLLFMMMIRVGRELRVPYFLPNIRWWESDPARKLLIPVSVSVEQRRLDGEIMDLSTAGCFIKCPEDFQDDDRVFLTFTLFGHSIECMGNIVWRASSTVTHPKGVGVKFQTLGKVFRRKLKLGAQKIRGLQVYTSVQAPEPIAIKKKGVRAQSEAVLEERAVGNAKG